MQGWASAHVYLGTALFLVATLHSGIQVGWNVHTLAYVLMCVVIASGLFGLYHYLHNPTLIAQNREGGTRGALFAELFELAASGQLSNAAVLAPANGVNAGTSMLMAGRLSRATTVTSNPVWTSAD